MKTYECDRCKKVFTLKGDYTRHLNRKIPCTEQLQIVIDNTTKESKKDEQSEQKTIVKNKCEYCHKIFSRADALSRHTDKYCKVKKLQDDSNEQLLQKILDEHKKLAIRIEKLEKDYAKRKQSV